METIQSPSPEMGPRKDTYERITIQILEALETGTPPWHGDFEFLPVNAVYQRPYRGINILALWAAASKQGFPHYEWATYKQWQDLGAQVRKGEKATSIVFWKVFDRPSDGEECDAVKPEKRFPLAREYSVFNAAQVDGYSVRENIRESETRRIETADNFFASLGANIRQDVAPYYSLEEDCVHIPPLRLFYEPTRYYAVLAHEVTHWTGAAHRLNRSLGARFGSKAYAAEELIAELGAAFLCADLAISSIPRPDHARYIASWIDLLSHDSRALFTASSKAQQAVDWMHTKRENIISKQPV